MEARNNYNKYNWNFLPLEVLSRYRDPQLQIDENYLYLFNLRPNIASSTASYHTYEHVR